MFLQRKYFSLIWIKKKWSLSTIEPANLEYFSDVPRRDHANSRSQGGQMNSEKKKMTVVFFQKNHFLIKSE